jgi:hypothetical protein
MEDAGLRLDAKDITTQSLAHNAPDQGGDEGGADSDIEIVGSEDECHDDEAQGNASDAGTVASNTGVQERWAAFLKNTRQVVENELQDMQELVPRLHQHIVALGTLHILFSADNTSRNNFVNEAQKTEQGALKILYPFIPTCQQSPRLTIPQFLFEGPEDYNTLFRVLKRLQKSNGFPNKIMVPRGTAQQPVQLDVVWHVGSDLKLVMIIRGRALSGPFGCAFCKWHRKEGMWLNHDSTAISEAQAVAWYATYQKPIHDADAAANKARSMGASDALIAAKQQLAAAYAALKYTANAAFLQHVQSPLIVQCIAHRKPISAKHFRPCSSDSVPPECCTLFSAVQDCFAEELSQKTAAGAIEDLLDKLDLSHQADDSVRVRSGSSLQESLRRLSDLKAYRLELTRRINTEYQRCVVEVQGELSLCEPALQWHALSKEHHGIFLATVLAGRKRKDIFHGIAGQYHCWVEVLHMKLNLVRTWFDHTRNILHVLFKREGTLRDVAELRACINRPCKPKRGTRPGDVFDQAGFNLATLLKSNFKLDHPRQGFDGERANQVLNAMCSEELWVESRIGSGVQELLQDLKYSEYRGVIVNLRGVWKGLRALCGAASMPYGANPDPLDTLDAAVQLFQRHMAFFVTYPAKDKEAYPFKYDPKGYDHAALEEVIPQQRMLMSMGLSLVAVSSTCIEHQNTDLHQMGCAHSNGGQPLPYNAHLAVVKTFNKLSSKNKVERAELYSEMAGTLPEEDALVEEA